MKPACAGGRPSPRIDDFFARVSGTPLADAFPVKRLVPPFIGMQDIADDARDACWKDISEQPRNGKSLAYLHIPFCENHCLFCGFYQNPWKDAAGAVYSDALVAQLRRDADKAYQAAGLVNAVYLGGGTPSALSAADLSRLVKAIRDYLPLAPDCEITLEARAHSLSEDKVNAALAAGVNRVSVGVQTFDSEVRRSMARRNTRESVVRLLEYLVATDAAAIVIDLIYGLPGQTLEHWMDDVRTAIETGIDGIDLYSLNLFPLAPLAMAIDKGKFTPVPREHYGSYYAAGSELLRDARWEVISTTHWRRTTRERNLYNLAIKQGAQCLAFGPGAGGFLNGYAYSIERDIERYQDAMRNRGSVLTALRRQAPYQDLFNRIRGDMECARLDHGWLDRILAEYDPNTSGVAPLLRQWERAGLLTMGRRWLDLTVAGRFWQVTMTQNLIDWLTTRLAASAEPA